ncbi:MAG: LEA type 2 family protein [Methanolobus sp.]|uniref:NDR1/HIN1-like protein n=1 Tax=Methanolobus sp. TaxID=1874737 RepID=UPI00272FF16F|nr:LEA type 2 family protein [Methanolobus sp.]MDP2218299.1 LEA type 2 family protein [Methanolobus sp.]
MGKISTYMGLIILLLLATIASMGCETREEQIEALQDTEITVREIEVNDISSEVIDLNITMDIYNPNNVTARLERMNYSIYANEVFIGNGTFEESVEIPPQEGRRTSTNFIAQTTSIPSTIVSALSEGMVVWTIEGVMYFDTPLGAIEQPFSGNISDTNNASESDNISETENTSESSSTSESDNVSVP